MGHRIVARDAWLAARKAHLRNEKALTRLRDIVAAERRALPWVEVDKQYVFDTPDGKESLAELFGRNSQLIVHHFMFGPDWEAGCPSCSLEADHAEGAVVHLENHDVSYVRVSRAPLDQILVYKERMGWEAKWVSSHGSDFNYDYHVSFTPEELAAGKILYNFAAVEGTSDLPEELPGLSVFYKGGGTARSSTPIPATGAATSKRSARSSISTSPRKAATRRRSWTGCGATTSTMRRVRGRAGALETHAGAPRCAWEENNMTISAQRIAPCLWFDRAASR